MPGSPVKRFYGADAVYIGGPGFGARHNASNSLSDIAGLVPFAHRYGAKIFVTLNTILHDDELEPAQRLITDLYETGVDALIVQDMGVMELDIPPIELHASTQCDIRSVEKAKFLSDVGFSQIVLARELNLQLKRFTTIPTRRSSSLFTAPCAWPIPGSAISPMPRPGAAPTAATAPGVPFAVYPER
jgi:hypothetical protein